MRIGTNRARRRVMLPILAAAAIAVAVPSYGGEIGTNASDNAWTRDSLSGDWGGLRSSLTERGITLGVSEVAEVLGNASGGRKTGAVFTGRAEFDLDLDCDKLADWKGATVHVSAFQIHGRGLTADNLKNLLDPSNIEASPATRLFDAYLEQSLFDDMLSIRIGQLAADDDFLISDYASTFINGTFGWAGIMAADLPNGGPAYPLATPGVRVKWTPSKSFYWQTAVFSGDPAGTCNGDAQICNHNGLTFATDTDAFVISEAGYERDGELPASVKLGAWYHSGQFGDLRYDVNGEPAAATGAEAYPRRSNYGVYAVFDKLLWHEQADDKQGIGAFARIGAAPDDRNLVPFYFDVGLNDIGPFQGRDSDVLGLAFAYAKISDRARAFDRDYNLVHPAATRPVRDYEAAVELSYSYVAAPWWILQPDVQYILHPAGFSADPSADPDLPAPAMKNALVIGVRTAIQF